MTLRDVVVRARSFTGRGCRYELGAGGRRRFLPNPWDEQKRCDCSGFVAGVLEIDRYLPGNPWYQETDGQWLETSAVVRDCLTPFGFWDPVARTAARPGHVLVYGDRDGRQGHIGIVSRIDDSGPVAVVHCSKGNERRTEDAIRETGCAGFWPKGAMVTRCAFIDEGHEWPEIPGLTFAPSR